MIVECAIIGGGPAGLNAALILGRGRKNTILFDNNKPRNAVTYASHGFITRDGVTPAQFRRIAYKEVLQYPTVEHRQQEVTAIDRKGEHFQIEAAGEHIIAKKVLLATGVKEEFPAIEGIYQFYGTSLFNCPYCDGWGLRDQPLILVSEQPSVYHTVQLLYSWSKDLIVSTNGKDILDIQQKKMLARKQIQLINQQVIAFEGEGKQLQQVRLADGSTIARSGGFITPRFVQAVPYVKQLGCEILANGKIQTDGAGRTSVPGFYVAGDASYIGPSQVVYAAADGVRAAISVHTDLCAEEFQ